MQSAHTVAAAVTLFPPFCERLGAVKVDEITVKTLCRLLLSLSVAVYQRLRTLYEMQSAALTNKKVQTVLNHN